MSTSSRFYEMHLRGVLPIAVPAWLHAAPSGRALSWDRVHGMLLGLAIGDALGNTTEGQMPYEREATRGEVRDYLPNWHAGGRPIGVPSDDSQMAFWTLESLLLHGRLDPDHLAHLFTTRPIFGMGGSVKAFRLAMMDGDGWERAATRSAGNGALMRIAPVVVPHAAAPSPAFWHDAVLAAFLTHNDTASVASCVAFVALIWDAMQMTELPPGGWWAGRFLSALDDLSIGTVYRTRTGGRFRDESGPFASEVRRRLDVARRERLDTLDGCNAFVSGAFLLETVPSVLWILERHGHDPEEAIVRAVNDTVDNDTIGAIVGAAVGALHGADRLPQRWREGLTGRTGASDDGRMQALIEQARLRFWDVARR